MTRLLLPIELPSQIMSLEMENTTTKEHAGTLNNNGVYHNDRTSGLHTAYHHQGDGSQWSAAENTGSCIYYISLNASQQNSFMQTGTPLLPNGLQVNCNQDNFYQDSRFLNSNVPQSNLRNPEADYLQNVPAHWTPQGANQPKQYNILVPKHMMKDSHSRDPGMTVKSVLPSSTTTTAQPHQQRGHTGQCETHLTHNNQVVYNHCLAEHNTQQATAYYRTPHSYISQSQQASRDNRLPIQQGMHVSCMDQRARQYPARLSPTFHSKEAIAQSDKDKAISRIIDSLKSFYPVHQDVLSTANYSSLYKGAQSGIATQPTPTTTSNTSQSSLFIPEETLSEHISVMSVTQDMAGSSQRTPYVPGNVLCVPTIDQNKSVGKKLRNSQSPEAPPPAKEEVAVHSSSGHGNLKAIAVVQPLYQQSSQVSSNPEAFDAIGYKAAATGSCESLQEIPEKTVCEQALSSRLTGKTLTEQHDALITPPSDVPRSQSCESADDPEASISKSSSGPTVTWTIKKLQRLIKAEESAQQKRSDLPVDRRTELCQLFRKNLGTLEARQKLLYLFGECKRFVMKHVTPNTVLTQLKPGVENQHYHILRDNSLYTEPPYRSTWLNINDQLDDIDREFGFPPSLRCPHMQRLDSQTDPVTAGSIAPEQVDNEVSDKGFKQPEPKLMESDVEKQVESSPNRAASPDDTQDGDSPDPCYSFKIQVLSPDKAKLIYERTESPEQQSKVACVEDQDSNHQAEKDASSSVAGDVPHFSVALLNETDCPIEEACCLSRLVGNIITSNPPLVKCKCGTKKSLKAVIDITGSDNEDSTTEMMDISRKSPCEAIVLIETQTHNLSSTDDASLYPKTKGVYTCADSDSLQSIISAACEGKIENSRASEIKISSLTSEGEDEKLPDVSSDSSVETEQAPVSAKTAPMPDVSLTSDSNKERKAESCEVLPLFEEPSYSKLTSAVESQLSAGSEVSVEPPVRKHSEANRKAAQLVLFGSVQSPTKTHKRKRHFSSESAVCTSSKPPEVLSVQLHSMKRQFSEPLSVQEESAKKKIFETWRKSFPVNPLKQRGKNTRSSALSLRAQEKQSVSTEKLKLLNLSLKSSDGLQCRMGRKRSSSGELSFPDLKDNV